MSQNKNLKRKATFTIAELALGIFLPVGKKAKGDCSTLLTKNRLYHGGVILNKLGSYPHSKFVSFSVLKAF